MSSDRGRTRCFLLDGRRFATRIRIAQFLNTQRDGITIIASKSDTITMNIIVPAIVSRDLEPRPRTSRRLRAYVNHKAAWPARKIVTNARTASRWTPHIVATFAQSMRSLKAIVSRLKRYWKNKIAGPIHRAIGRCAEGKCHSSGRPEKQPGNAHRQEKP